MINCSLPISIILRFVLMTLLFMYWIAMVLMFKFWDETSKRVKIQLCYCVICGLLALGWVEFILINVTWYNVRHYE